MVEKPKTDDRKTTSAGGGAWRVAKDGNGTHRKFLQWTFYLLLPFIVFRLYFYPYPSSSSSSSFPPQFPEKDEILSNFPPQFPEKDEILSKETGCDYTEGKWVADKTGPLYNGTSCGTIKDGQNCMSHGRPDQGFLYWKWQPQSCELPRFDPAEFLEIFTNGHIAFVGDSMARNQLESLVCMLSSVSPPNLVYTNGDDNKFRRWHFSSHNATVSIYWSPFLVKGVEKSKDGPDHNELYLDQIDERWGKDLGEIDAVVLSIGHWFLHPAVYLEGGEVLGCHYCPGMNHTEIGFYDVLRKAVKTTLKSVSERGDGIDVILTTFSPSHFEGEWDKFGACPKSEPYGEGEKLLEGMDAEMRRIEVEEVELAKVGVSNQKNKKKNVRLEALDVTKLSLMRPDGHPGAYMYPFPFANGISERVQNDCVHWCLPGPVDTWNQILLQVIKRLRRQ